MTKKLKLVFADNSDLIISLNNSVTAEKLVNMSKHLQKIPLRFSNYDNPFSYTSAIGADQLIKNANLLNVKVDTTRLTDQAYLNSLHKIYEQGYDGNSTWLEFHEAIHILEQVVSGNIAPVGLGYGSEAGVLNVNYSYEELQTCQTTFSSGDCFVFFNELGKTPYSYWSDHEPDDFNRLIELSKPMIRLHFKIFIALTDINRLPSEENQAEFDAWFAPYKQKWCDHWGIPNWSIEQMRGGIRVGTIDNIDLLTAQLKKNITPTRLLLINE
jgi:hypothetical protein